MTRRRLNILIFGPIFLIISCSTTKNIKTAEALPNSEINRNNYYIFYSTAGLSPVTTNWLRRNEAIPIIIDELEILRQDIRTFVKEFETKQ